MPELVQVEARFAAIAASSGENTPPPDLSSCAPDFLRLKWNDLEKAECDYEAALNGRLQDL